MKVSSQNLLKAQCDHVKFSSQKPFLNAAKVKFYEDFIMSKSKERQEETYSVIFTSLKHPTRRKILRMLIYRQMTFSEILETVSIDSGHLSYHLGSLGELITRSSEGKYGLSTIGEAAVRLMSDVEEPKRAIPSDKLLSKKLKKSPFVIILLTFGLILTAIAIIPMSMSIERKELQIEPFLFYDGTAYPSILEPSQGGLPISFGGVPNSTIFQIEINCNAPIVMKFFDLNFIPFNETRDFLMQREVATGNTTYYWTPIYGKLETSQMQNYFIEITALERTVEVKAKITSFTYHEVRLNDIVYKSFLEPYLGYFGLALIAIAIVAQWKRQRFIYTKGKSSIA